MILRCYYACVLESRIAVQDSARKAAPNRYEGHYLWVRQRNVPAITQLLCAPTWNLSEPMDVVLDSSWYHWGLKGKLIIKMLLVHLWKRKWDYWFVLLALFAPQKRLQSKLASSWASANLNRFSPYADNEMVLYSWSWCLGNKQQMLLCVLSCTWETKSVLGRDGPTTVSNRKKFNGHTKYTG